jgi:hypothetical protein
MANGYVDAIDFSWSDGYTWGRNKLLESQITLTASNVINCLTTGKVMNYRVCSMVLDPSEIIPKGAIIEITDTYSKDGATASAVMFKGMVAEKEDKHPYVLTIKSQAKEDLEDKPSGDESGRSDEIITAQTADINHIGDGTHENGSAMGTLTYAGVRSYGRVWRNLAVYEGSIFYLWYDAGTLKVNFNDTDTDTGINIDQDSNIKIIHYGRPARRYTKVVVHGLGGVEGSATASAEDILNYGTNTYHHYDFTLDSTKCGTAAANILAELNEDHWIVKFEYSITNTGYIQEGQTITFGFEQEGYDTIESAEFLVWQSSWDSVEQKGTLTIVSSVYYEVLGTDLIEENSAQTDTNTTAIGALKQVFNLQMSESGGATDNGYYITLNAVGELFRSSFLIEPHIDASKDAQIHFGWQRGDANNDTISYTISVGANPMDGSAAWSETNVENATGITLPACANGNVEDYTYTLAAADYAVGDMINFIIRCAEARTCYFFRNSVQAVLPL